MVEMYPAARVGIKWVGDVHGKTYRPPWLGYNPSFRNPAIEELDGTTATWDVVVKKILDVDDADRTASVVIQFAARQAPHNRFEKGLAFELIEGLRPVWSGKILDVSDCPRDRSFWLSVDYL